ncbi:MAG TPA: hypothetical protein VKQ11_20145 [Candidatus Sulfotelmatobacter sp.]|nr:hypothetical protein [Candidatus Sulfotelmatobacter sp.]
MQRLIFGIFAGLILLSMVREWSIPAACARVVFVPAVSQELR